MFKWLGGLIDSNEKELRRLQPLVDRINEFEPAFERLGDGELGAKTGEFKALDPLFIQAHLLAYGSDQFTEVRRMGILLRHAGIQQSDQGFDTT